MIPNIGHTIRDLRRATELVQTLIRYGFKDAVQELGLDRLIDRGRRTLRLAKPDASIERLPREVRLRKAMEELGPTFIKLGQVLSTRPDLVPPAWADEFAKLQDNVKTAPADLIRSVISQELGDRVETLFESIHEEPIAAASIAQVHRATLRTGEEVVLKVLRPGIGGVLASDIALMRIVARFIEDHFREQGYSPTETVEQFAQEVQRETDLGAEGRATDRMRRSFEHDEGVHFPLVYWQATTPSVLCLEYIRGTVLSRLKPGEFTPEERRAIVANGARATFRQCLEIGFFHADPHPGNLIALRDEQGRAGPICFIDCGMTGHVDPRTSQLLADLVHGTVNGELERVIDVVMALSGADPEIRDQREFRSDVWEFIGHFQDANLSDLHMGALLREFFDKLRKNKLRCPADLVFLIKAITTIEGVGAEICPEYDLAAQVKPFIERLVRRRYGIRALRQRLQNSLARYAELAEALPRDAMTLIQLVRRQKLTVNLEHHGLDRLTRAVEHASRNIARALIITALLVASSILMLADRAAGGSMGALTFGSVAGFALAGALGFLMATVGRRH